MDDRRTERAGAGRALRAHGDLGAGRRSRRLERPGRQHAFFDDIWAYDPAAEAWRELPSLGDVPPARYGSCASLGPDGRLWISHGFTDSGRFDDTRAYDFATGEWTDETPDGDLPSPALPARLLLVE